MKMPGHRLLVGLLLLSLLLPARSGIVTTAVASDQPLAVEDGGEEDLQPKFFFFSFLINVALKFAVASFKEWRQQRLTNEFSEPISYSKLLRNSALSGLVSTVGDVFFPIFSFKSADAAPAARADDPQHRQTNFQGAHVAVLGFDAAGVVTGLRPLNATFRTGERIKLKVVSTFDAWLIVEHVGADGERRQIFPRDPGQAVALRAGTETLLPLVEDQYFQFAGEAGKEQLVLSFRDPRVRPGTASDAEVVSQEEPQGLGLLQEVRAGSYPAITQSLGLNHER